MVLGGEMSEVFNLRTQRNNWTTVENSNKLCDNLPTKAIGFLLSYELIVSLVSLQLQAAWFKYIQKCLPSTILFGWVRKLQKRHWWLLHTKTVWSWDTPPSPQTTSTDICPQPCANSDFLFNVWSIESATLNSAIFIPIDTLYKLGNSHFWERQSRFEKLTS